MLLDRTQARWATAALVLGAAAWLAYRLDATRHLNGPSGSTALGLTLGIIALLLMLFCAALGLKRRIPHWRIGRAQAWMRGHIWLGLLTCWLVALHGAFKAGGPLTTALWWLLGIVTVSGVVGLIFQQFIPSLLLHGVPGETIAQQLDRELSNLAEDAKQVVIEFAGSADRPEVKGESGKLKVESDAAAPAVPVDAAASDAAPAVETKPAKEDRPDPNAPPAGGEPLRLFYRQHVVAVLTGEPSVLSDPQQRDSRFAALRTNCPPQIHPGIDALAEICRRREQLLRQRVLMRVLFAWLFIHVPLSWALLVLAAAHAVAALMYWS